MAVVLAQFFAASRDATPRRFSCVPAPTHGLTWRHVLGVADWCGDVALSAQIPRSVRRLVTDSTASLRSHGCGRRDGCLCSVSGDVVARVAPRLRYATMLPTPES